MTAEETREIIEAYEAERRTRYEEYYIVTSDVVGRKAVDGVFLKGRPRGGYGWSTLLEFGSVKAAEEYLRSLNLPDWVKVRKPSEAI